MLLYISIEQISMLRIGIIAESFGDLPDPFQVTSRSLMKSSGYNIGNWAFWNATRRLINEDAILISGHPQVDDYINKIDLLVIPAANWLQPRYDFSWLADFIEGIDKQCVIIGLGAQSHDDDIVHPLTKGTLRMLKAASSRTPYLGLRGEYTKKVCEHYGITNVKVLGCPSLFTNNSPTLGRILNKKWEKRTNAKTIIHAAMFPSNVKHVEQWLFNYLISHCSASYVIQAPQSLLKPQFQEQLEDSDIEFLEKYRHTFQENIPLEELLDKLFHRGYLPYSIDAWINYISFFSRSIGTRIHGSVLSLSATTPTICITHDSRTKELCNVMKIPSTPCESISKEHTIDELFDNISIDANVFDENRRALAKQYQSLLHDSGATQSNHLNKILK